VAAARADTPRFGMPLDCIPGETCWISAYVDHQAGKGVRDYACGIATYDAAPDDRHKGTDIAIRDLGVMREGVTVRAAAAGTVIGLRDGVADVSVREGDPANVAGRECGNGVRLDHGEGWFSQYCHLRQGSIVVRRGDRVEAGAPIGLVGLSGATEYPHLHFQVERAGEIVDPFAGPGRAAACGPGPEPLWTADVLARWPYAPTVLYNAGFAAGEPDIAAIRDGRRPTEPLAAGAPALVLWADMFNVRAGDRLEMRITAPDGSVIFDHDVVIEKNQARRFAFAGVRRKTPVWASGTYRGLIRLVPAAGVQAVERVVEPVVRID
jgi:murein DD-endopeptidase MepM/ murein hydrolase activator NlpD